jgi:hypothetical protein
MQETLEEAAERLYPINNTGSMFMPNRDELNNSYKQEAFIEGAKWQQERMHSEEEVYDIIIKLFDNYASNYTDKAIEDFEENFIKQ